MIWIAFVGFLLEVVGLGIAVTGLADTYREATKRSLWTDLWARLRARVCSFVRRVLRRPGPSQVIQPTSTVIEVRAGTGAFTRGKRPSPPDATIDELIEYLDSVTTDLYEDLDAARRHAAARLDEARQELQRQIRTVDARADDANRAVGELSRAFVGIDGAGLRKAAVGLMVTGVGVLLSTIGLIA